MIKAVIFDMGGVLVDLDMEACKQAFKDDLGFHVTVAEIEQIESDLAAYRASTKGGIK